MSVTSIAGHAASERAQAYVALLGILQFEVDGEALGQSVESWALFMSPLDRSKPTLVSVLKVVRERCPMVSLIRACVTLGLDIRDVMADTFEVAA